MAAIRSRAGENGGGSEGTEALYRAHAKAVAALCRSLLRDRAEAEDATQQVFLSAHRALLNGATPREPLAWLLAVARYECYARFRRRAATPVPSEDAPDGVTPDASVNALRAGDLARLWDEVGRMPPAQREAFLLREIRGLTYGQVAAELSTSRPSVRSLLQRARVRLRHRLGEGAAAFGGVPWVQPLLRLVAGGDGGSPVPAAAKAAAVGLGALALAGGASPLRIVHHAPTAPKHPAGSHGAAASTSVRLVAASPVASVATAPHEQSTTGGDRSGGSARSGSHEGSDETGVPTAPVVQATTSSDTHDGGGDSTDTSTTTTATTESSSDGGSGSLTTTTSSVPNSSDDGGGGGGDS